jgi:hypothetical protein
MHGNILEIYATFFFCGNIFVNVKKPGGSCVNMLFSSWLCGDN